MQNVDWKNFIFDLRWNKNLLLIVAEPLITDGQRDCFLYPRCNEPDKEYVLKLVALLSLHRGNLLVE